jgi:hypothetical protein
MAIAIGSVLAPRVQLYTSLVCSEFKPELTTNYTSQSSSDWWISKIPEPDKGCYADDVQAEVAKLIAGECF